MASTPLGDIPGARFNLPVISHASVASNGATARIQAIGPFGHNVRVRQVWWSPSGAIQNSTAATASYRGLKLYHGGAAGTASASVIASANLIASVAQYGTTALTVDTAVTLSAGHIAYFQQDSAGAANDPGTVLAAGQFSGTYEVI